MPGYKFYYFEKRGRGEMCRYAFAATGIEYEDIRLTMDEWAKEKESGRPYFGHLPMLITPGPEGKVLCGSTAILKYICKKGGLCPEDPFDEAIADSIVDAVLDVAADMIKIYYEPDQAKQAELQKKFAETDLPKYFGQFEARVKGPFFFGDKPCNADVMFFQLTSNYLGQGSKEHPASLDKFPKLVQNYKAMMALPGIKAWVDHRPETSS